MRENHDLALEALRFVQIHDAHHILSAGLQRRLSIVVVEGLIQDLQRRVQ